MADDFTTDEVAMLRFLQLCVPSLDPESYQNVLDACGSLCGVRPRLAQGSVLKCLKQIFGDDYKEPEQIMGSEYEITATAADGSVVKQQTFTPADVSGVINGLRFAEAWLAIGRPIIDAGGTVAIKKVV